MNWKNLLVVLPLLYTACQSDNQPILDEEAPEIIILSPQENQVFEPGEPLNIQVELRENLELHEFSVLLKNTLTNSITIIEEDHAHTKSYSIEKTIPLPNKGDRDYELIVEASDHDENSNQKTIHITVK